MSAKLIDGNALASEMKRELAKEVRTLNQIGIKPCLAVCIVGDDPASHIYVSRKAKACEEVGVVSLCKHLPDNTSMSEIQSLIWQWNSDPEIHGILVQLPLPNHLNQYKIVNSINPSKDVDGFCSINLGRIAHNKPHLLPCTPSAVQYILASQNIPLKGKHVVIINDTIVVGRPLALMMLNEGATVTVCHKETQNLSDITKIADVVVVAVGRRPEKGCNPTFRLTASMIKQDAVVIDVGINRLPNGKIIGDADSDVKEVASHLTPVPGSVGPNTIVFLLKNTIEAAKNGKSMDDLSSV